MTVRWHQVVFVVAMLAVVGCDPEEPSRPGNEAEALPESNAGRDDREGAEEPTEPEETEGPDDVDVDPLLLSGRFGVAFTGTIGAEAEADGLAVRASLNHAPTLNSLDVEVTNDGEETKGAVQVRVGLDYSDVSRSDPDPNAEDSARLPVEQPDEVVAAVIASVGSCRVEPDGAAQALVTCDVGDLAPQSEARVSIEVVGDDLAGAIDLVIDVTARN